MSSGRYGGGGGRTRGRVRGRKYAFVFTVGAEFLLNEIWMQSEEGSAGIWNDAGSYSTWLTAGTTLAVSKSLSSLYGCQPWCKRQVCGARLGREVADADSFDLSSLE